MKISLWPIERVKPYETNPRKYRDAPQARPRKAAAAAAGRRKKKAKVAA